ncbi:XRE family transcriptional regulator [Vibrio harveyi]|uniref:XRE family transcriptional regulator n=1 Tax=Vibrio harveyi TaxID=669 RepID=UPI002380BBEC|nr:XRE family transcriptional regulator [Vibrio harveyi]
MRIDKATKENNKIVLMKTIKDIVRKERLKQREVAIILEIKQPRVSDLLALKDSKFTIDILMGYLELLGYKLVFENIETERGKPIKASVSKSVTTWKVHSIKEC